VSQGSFADFWRRLAEHFSGNAKVIFGLMNEPHDMTTELWLEDANAAISAIRTAGAPNLILVPGNGWTGAHSWTSSYYGTPNADVMKSVVDPLDDFAFEMHQYLDGDSSGTAESCVSETIGSERMQSATAWLRQEGYRGFLGEFGGGRNPTCYGALDDLVSYLENNDDVWLGWTYWAAGPWWGDYMFTIDPAGGQDRPQMDVLETHL
jgi:endoglucanase